jgi:hypothetical protein
MPTIEEALAYMGYDQSDAMVLTNVQRAMATARAVMLGAVGADVEQYLPDDPRVKELILIYTDDLYTERGVKAKVSGATRKLVADMVLQLKLELRRKKDEVGAAV